MEGALRLRAAEWYLGGGCHGLDTEGWGFQRLVILSFILSRGSRELAKVYREFNGPTFKREI